MSYILDALRKADAEREQGRVPGLHSQLASPPAQATDEDSPPLDQTPISRMALSMAAGAGVLLVGAVLWWIAAPDQHTSAPVSVATDANAVGGPAEPGLRSGPATGSAAAALPRVEPITSPDLPLPQAHSPTRAAAAVPAASTPAGAAPAVQPLNAMPDSLRRSLPTLVFGGAMHSDNAASRMLVINNNVYREGDEPAPGLVLEEIRLKSAVFRFQGQRFSVGY